MYYSDGITVQRNEVYQTQQKAGGADSNGILLCRCGHGFGDARVRYNVVNSNRRYQIYLHSGAGTTAYVHDNGGADYAGTPVYDGAPGIGAFEY
jgi:hypothetical protein